MDNSQPIPQATAAKLGDTLTIDFKGMVGGVAFPGGTGTDHDLALGSKSFIPGFEEQLVGAKVGEERAVKVRFPDDYHAKELAGKDAVFIVNVKGNKGRGGAVDMAGEMAAIQDDMEKLRQLRTVDMKMAQVETHLHELEDAQKRADIQSQKAHNLNGIGRMAGLAVGVGAVVGGLEKMRLLPKIALALVSGGVGEFVGDRMTRGGVQKAEAWQEKLGRDAKAYEQAVGRELGQNDGALFNGKATEGITRR